MGVVEEVVEVEEDVVDKFGVVVVFEVVLVCRREDDEFVILVVLKLNGLWFLMDMVLVNELVFIVDLVKVFVVLLLVDDDDGIGVDEVIDEWCIELLVVSIEFDVGEFVIVCVVKRYGDGRVLEEVWIDGDEVVGILLFVEFVCKEDRMDVNELRVDDRFGNVVWIGLISDDLFWMVVVVVVMEELKVRLRVMDVWKELGVYLYLLVW